MDGLETSENAERDTPRHVGDFCKYDIQDLLIYFENENYLKSKSKQFLFQLGDVLLK